MTIHGIWKQSNEKKYSEWRVLAEPLPESSTTTGEKVFETGGRLFVTPGVSNLRPDLVIVGRAWVMGVGEDKSSIHVPKIIGSDLTTKPVWSHEGTKFFV